MTDKLSKLEEIEELSRQIGCNSGQIIGLTKENNELIGHLQLLLAEYKTELLKEAIAQKESQKS